MKAAVARRRTLSVSRGDVPLTIAGLTAWYRGDTPVYQDTARTTPAVNDGDPVGSWTDLSGLGNHATQGTAGLRPVLKKAILGGKDALRFDATDDFMATGFALAQPNTIFVVWQFRVGAGSAYSLYGSNQWCYSDNRSSQIMYAGGSTRNFSPAPDLTAGLTPWAVCHQWNDASTKAWFTGGSSRISASPGTVGWTGNTIVQSDGRRLDGDIAELIAYSGALSLANINAIGAYLNTRYGVSWTTAV